LKYNSLLLSAIAFLTITLTPTVFSAPDVWDVLRKEFTLDHEVTRAEVQTQLRWLIAHPSYIQKLARQSEPYIYHILTEIKKRKLPGELALIPMIESSYDPFAYSGAGAAGLWQLMPGTGTDLGLKQDWWFDGRRSIRPSTNAALNYLSYLYNFFNGNWILAFAAYDAGEGAVGRVIKNSGQSSRKIDFWSLQVPAETRAYVPRLLAIAEVIQNPLRYHVQLPAIPVTPFFEEVNIGSQIDLNHAAKLAGISYKDLIKLNPGFNRWATAPYRPYKLLIPASKAVDFIRKLSLIPEEERVSLTRHLVQSGENLMLIAQRYHTTIHLIMELNQLKSDAVKKGQYVLIPRNKQPMNTPTPQINPVSTSPHYLTTKQYKVIHIVQKDDSYTQIQAKYNVSASDIAHWNHLKVEDGLQPGQALTIWKQTTPSDTYIVKAGDSLNQIAQRNHTSVDVLFKLNPALAKHRLHSGQQIRLG